MTLTRRTLAAAALAPMLVSAAALFWYWPRLTLSPQAALARYLAAPEAANAIDPLVLVGEPAVEPVLREVVDLRLGYRSGLIRFLGNGRYAMAEPVLDRLVDRKSEPGYLRCEALMALTRVNQAAGQNKAMRYKSDMGDLGYCAKQVLAGLAPEERRTYHQARLATLLD